MGFAKYYEDNMEMLEERNRDRYTWVSLYSSHQQPDRNLEKPGIECAYLTKLRQMPQ